MRNRAGEDQVMHQLFMYFGPSKFHTGEEMTEIMPGAQIQISLSPGLFTDLFAVQRQCESSTFQNTPSQDLDKVSSRRVRVPSTTSVNLMVNHSQKAGQKVIPYYLLILITTSQLSLSWADLLFWKTAAVSAISQLRPRRGRLISGFVFTLS